MAEALKGVKLYKNGTHAKALAEEVLQGSTVGLLFTAQWCGPCRNFAPLCKAFYDKVAEKYGFEIVLVTADNNEADMKNFLKSQGNYWYIKFGSRKIEELKSMYQINSFPSMVVINAKGGIISRDARNQIHNQDAFALMKSWSVSIRQAINTQTMVASHGEANAHGAIGSAQSLSVLGSTGSSRTITYSSSSSSSSSKMGTSMGGIQGGFKTMSMTEQPFQNNMLTEITTTKTVLPGIDDSVDFFEETRMVGDRGKISTTRTSGGGLVTLSGGSSQKTGSSGFTSYSSSSRTFTSNS